MPIVDAQEVTLDEDVATVVTLTSSISDEPDQAGLDVFVAPNPFAD